MSTIKVNTLTTLNGSGNITVSRPFTGLSGSGASLTALNATELTSGTVPTARLGSGTANNTVFLRGDGSWQTAGSTSASDLTSGTLPDARFPSTLPAASGVNLTALNATNLGSGTVPTARLGSGTANSSVHLRGDGTWAAAGGGKIIQHRYDVSAANNATSSTSYVVTSLSQTITPASTSNDIIILFMSGHIYQDTTNIGYYYDMTIFKNGSNIGPASGINGHYGQQANIDDLGFSVGFAFLDEPASTSSLTYDIRHKVNTGSASINMGHRGYSYMHLFELEGGTD